MPPWNTYEISIQRRFFLYMLAFMIFILCGGVAALWVFGGLRTEADAVTLLRKERDHFAQGITRKLGETSAQAVSLSRELSASLQRRLAEQGLSISDLSGQPDILTGILSGEINRLLFSLEKNKTDGVFVVLNATVNPGVENAANSRAGLYIRNIGQGFMNRYADLLFLRGPSQIAITEGFNLQVRWTPEFDVHDQPFWERPLQTCEENPSLPLSRRYFWYLSDNFPGLSENVIVCSAPLVDGEGRFLGVCGFETGARKFARDNPLDTNNTPDATGIFFTFSSPDGKLFHPGKALFTGNVVLGREVSNRKEVTAGGNYHGLEVFRHEGNDAYLGLWSEIALYPDDSPFADSLFAAAIVVPKRIFDGIVSVSRLRLILIGLVLLCLSVALSMFLSARYEKPFKELMSALKSGDMNAKSHIQEIDDLVEFMRSQLRETQRAEDGSQEAAEDDGKHMEKTSEDSMEDLLDVFVENTKKLTRAESDVFNLYFEGHTAQEIASILNVSISTIKTHNRRIYAKLNVSSSKELLTWIHILTASGRTPNDSRQKQFDNIRNIVKNIKSMPGNGI
jgi:DNA-binding CsgD family transcriptional regulator